jgi:hypothetical protein
VDADLERAVAQVAAAAVAAVAVEVHDCLEQQALVVFVQESCRMHELFAQLVQLVQGR